MNTKTTLQKLRINEIHTVYIDNLEEWISVPVYELESIDKFTSSIVDWDNFTLVEYKKLLIEAIDLEVKVRSKINSYVVRDEIYEQIIKKNPGLMPKRTAGSGLPFYTDQESSSVMEWFSSHKIHGKRPEVISNESE